MKTLCGIAVVGIAVLFTIGGLEARTWTSAADSSKTLEGAFVGSDGTNVEIKLANGKTIKPLLSAFSKADQEFVAAQSKPGSAPAPAPADSKPAAPPKPGDLEPIQFEIWDIRTCCSTARKMYEEALRDVDGIKMEFDENQFDKKIIKVDAKTKVAAREALDKIVAAGLYGGTDTEQIKFKADRSKAKGEMTAAGVVFCCNKSVDALENAMKRARGAVDGEKGVTEHTIKKSKDTFEIKGTATAGEVLRHARLAGFNFTLEDTPAGGAPPE